MNSSLQLLSDQLSYMDYSSRSIKPNLAALTARRLDPVKVFHRWESNIVDVFKEAALSR
mgnify:CR=1